MTDANDDYKHWWPAKIKGLLHALEEKEDLFDSPSRVLEAKKTNAVKESVRERKEVLLRAR